MAAMYIFAVVAVVFLGLGLVRMSGRRASARLQGGIWLLIGAIFAIVSAYLFYQQSS